MADALVHQKKRKKPAADFKVVYISSPMKVKTSASEFRALVQKLTGQDSDAERFMELINGAAPQPPHDLHLDQTSFVDRAAVGGGRDRDRGLDSGELPAADAPDEEDVLRSFDGMVQNLLNEASDYEGMRSFSGLEKVIRNGYFDSLI